MHRVAFRWSLAVACVALAPLSAACGRTSLNTFVGDDVGASAGRAGEGGTSAFAGANGTAGSAGTFGNGLAGMASGVGGTAMGGMPAAGMPSGGMQTAGSGGSAEPDPSCLLSTTDCYTASEPECAASRMACIGALGGSSVIWGTRYAVVLDLATSVDGHVAVAGYFGGLLNLDQATLPTVSDGDDGFVLVFDSQRNLLLQQYFGGVGAQAITGLRFAPGGDLLVQGVNDANPAATVETTAGGGFVARLDPQGQQLWSYAVGAAGTHPGRIGVDNDGNISIVGGFFEHFDFRGGGCDADGYSSYVVHLDQNGNADWLHCYLPDGLQGAAAERLVVDDEDNLVILGNGTTPDNLAVGYVQKLNSVGGPVFVHTFQATEDITANALAVDRKMQVLIGGRFLGKLALGDARLETDRPGVDDTFIAKLSGSGDWTWAQSHAGADDATSTVGALTTDPADNVVAGESSYDAVGLRKLRDSGSAVWARSFTTQAPTYMALASDTAGNLWFSGTFVKTLQLESKHIDAQGQQAVFLLQVGR